MEDLISRLKAANAQFQRRDGLLGKEMLGRRTDSESTSRIGGRSIEELQLGPRPLIEVDGQTVDRLQFEQETIVLRTGRPVLAVIGDEAQLVFPDSESDVWKSRLQEASVPLAKAARAVGRIEVEGHDLAWLGTGWLVRTDVVVTNRHVAAEFARNDGASFVFRQGISGAQMSASIDFLEEIGSLQERTFRLKGILHIEDPDGPDVAFLHVAPTRKILPSPIRLSTQAEGNELVAVIGYPARDSRIPDQELMDKIFGNVYDKKRLAPGQLIGSDATSVRHDCSTLGGNSGSVVLSLETGEAVGLHFAGRFLRSNFAVPSTIVAERLEKVLNGRTRRSTHQQPVPDLPTATNHSALAIPRPETKFSFVVPLRVTMEVENPYPDNKDQRDQATAVLSTVIDTQDEVFIEEAPADYRDRLGYMESFLGESVPMPSVTRQQDDVLSFMVDGNSEHVLRYEHFSVMMSRSRRLCLFSAVNIDGLQSTTMPRAGWRTDPRIPLGAQIRHECYGPEPKFSRGHMTRREDPVWGPQNVASKANMDSMHVTNAVPQMQPFNAGVWLELENYALQNARKDDMKVSVFTGPILTSEDPYRYGVPIPTEFWKVIVFIHDETKQLCATGYTMSQQDFLSEQEFVFGKHKTAQQSIASIEQRTGLAFGPLTALDPFLENEGMVSELTDISQIQFIGP